VKSHINSYSPDFPGMRPEFVCFMELPQDTEQLLEPFEEDKHPRRNNKNKIIKFIKNLDNLHF
jgi:hypothetical protein